MSDKAIKSTDIPSQPHPKKSTSQKRLAARIEELFSDLGKELIPEPYPLEPTPPEPVQPLPSTAAKRTGADIQAIDRAVTPPEEKTEKPQPSAVLPAVSAMAGKTMGGQSAVLRQHAPDSGVSEGEDDKISPAGKTLTPIAWESLRQGRPIAENSRRDQPAMLAYARQLGGTLPQSATDAGDMQELSDDWLVPQTLLLEILDMDPERSWSEDEITLVEQVTDQLSLALENARLFQESRTRAEQLAILNEMSRNLTTQLNVEEVLDTIYHYTSRLIETANFHVAFYEEETNEVAFPLVIEEDEPTGTYQSVHWPTRAFGEGLIEHVIRTRQPFLLTTPLQEEVSRVMQVKKTGEEIRESDVSNRQPLSWLGVPMIYGDQVIGVIAVQSYSQPQLYDETHRNSLVSIASQAAVAIQNARLFQQTQSALSALEISERYQKGVAQAVAVLTERGITALSEVLQILGKATQASRVGYIETQVDQRGVYWRWIAEWCAEYVPSQLNNPKLRRFSTSWLSSWFDQLNRDGFISTLARSASPEEKEFLDSLGARSFLQFAIPGRHEIPGGISFEQIDYDRIWSRDEIAALRTAASALANTLSREDLFTQVQLNLSETGAMYQASAHLNSAASYDEILDVLRQHTILGHVNASDVSLNFFDKPWGVRPERLIPIARWTAKADSSALQVRDQVDEPDRDTLNIWTSGEQLLHPEHPIVVMDIATDPRFDESGRSMYLETLGVKSMISIPLNVTGRWMGQIIATYRQITVFPEQEIRRLISLAGQAAVAIESLRLLDETRQRNEELATINQIISAASQTLDLNQILPEVMKRALAAIEFESGLISIVDSDLQELQLAVHHNMPEALIRRLSEQGMKESPCDLVYQSGRTIHIPDINVFPTELKSWQRTFEGLRSVGFCSYLGVPLTSKGIRLGTICTFSKTPRTINPQRLSLIEAIGRQVGVVVDNARAYELSQKAVVEIREAERLKTQFLANMSHELRTPLNSIIGFSRVILKGIDGPISDLQSQDLTAIYNSGQHLLGLINDVLDLSKIEAGKMELAFEENVNLAEIIKSVMSTTVGLVKDKSIELNVDTSPHLPLLKIDPMKIRQVLLNLLSNAAKFTERGSITVKAEEISTDHQSEVIVRVIDTGPGIAPEDQAKLFQPFSQVDGSPTRRTGGSGLGLSICHHLVRMHGGRIGLQSQKGKGSTFYFTLPVHRPENLETIVTESQPELPDLERISQMAQSRSAADTIRLKSASPDTIQDKPAEPLPTTKAEIDQDMVVEEDSWADLHSFLEVVQFQEAGLAPEASSPAREIEPTIHPPASMPYAQGVIESEKVQEPSIEPTLAVGSPPRKLIRTQASSKVILSIDSDPQIIGMYKRYLANQGYSVIALTDLQKAITVARNLQPFAITLDILTRSTSGDVQSPSAVLDGWSVLKALKSDPDTRNIPVIICSIYTDQEKAIRLGATDYLLKPILEEDLTQAIQRLR